LQQAAPAELLAIDVQTVCLELSNFNMYLCYVQAEASYSFFLKKCCILKVILTTTEGAMLNLFAAVDTYDYTYTTTTTNSSGGLFAGTMLVVLMLVALAFAVVAIIAMWRIFEKAGEKGWKSLIPIYNSWILFELSGKPGWY
jgi:hypothetical protein